MSLYTLREYHLDVEDSAYSINRNSSIMVSRNAPIAFVVGVAGFLGSNLADELLEKNIQVIGIDDFSSGSKANLRDAVKNKNFHLINESISSSRFSEGPFIKLPRLDYAFFAADREDPQKLLSLGLQNFLEFIRKTKEGLREEGEELEKKDKEDAGTEKPRIVLVSSIELYDNKLEYKDKLLKEAEISFARYVKHYKLNARVVRLAPVFGPRMVFSTKDPIVRLIQACLNGELQDEQSSLEFSTRSLYVSDAVSLLIKSVLSGATAHKIYDGALISPIKVSEIKQILLNPSWHEERGFQAAELPPWVTPNLEKTVKELSWKPRVEIIEALKRTISYFKENEIEVPKADRTEFEKNIKGWSFKNYEEGEGGSKRLEETQTEKETEFSKKKRRGFKGRIGTFLVIGLIMFGLVYPIGSLAVGGLTIRYHLKQSRDALEEGDFDKAQNEIRLTKDTLDQSKDLVASFNILKRLGALNNQLNQIEQMLGVLDEGIDGVAHATEGSKALFQTTKIISGEDISSPREYYQKAQSELTVASQKIARVKATVDSDEFLNSYPQFIKSRAKDLGVKLNLYSDLVEKARIASYLLPEVTAVDGKKSYLVLLQNNLELRPTGGFIGSYGKFDFEGGRLKGIKVDDIYNLDGGLKDVIEPPLELKNDLGIPRWYLRDSNFEPDFPTSARQSEFFYKKEAGETVNGVIAMDLGASAKLLDAVDGLDLPEYGEHVDGGNLFERAISHAEVGFFPGSQAKKNYLVSLQTQLFNKVFYLSKQNWPGIIQAVAESLEQKHMLVYLEDPTIFSYLSSANWSGVFPRAPKETEGQTNDFLAVVEANMGANKSNYYLSRKFNLETSLGKEGQINHKLKLSYKNSSPSEVFPAGKYKNRLRVYLPLGAKLNKAMWGEADITSKVTTLSDYGRAGYSMLLEVMPKEQTTLILDYNLSNNLSFKDNQVQYKLDVLKQPGTGQDEFNWVLHYPINFALASSPDKSVSTQQELTIATDLLTDRSFLLQIRKK